MPSRLKPLSREDHEEAARLLNEAQAALTKAARLLADHLGAGYVDKVLRVQRDVMDKLIQPLRNDWEAQKDSDGHWRFALHEDPHHAVNYSPRR